jgi:hypothetical protein
MSATLTSFGANRGSHYLSATSVSVSGICMIDDVLHTTALTRNRSKTLAHSYHNMFPDDTDMPISSYSEERSCSPRHVNEIQPSVTVDPVSALAHVCGSVCMYLRSISVRQKACPALTWCQSHEGSRLNVLADR